MKPAVSLPSFLVAGLLFLGLPLAGAWADKVDETIQIFMKAGQSSRFFQHCYGYAVFPTIAKGAIGIGGAHGKGRVYERGVYAGDVIMNQLTVGFQLGGQAYSQIIFFEDKRAFDEFTSDDFEFGAQASAVAITASASASASSTGPSAGVSGGKHDALTAGAYRKGMATFTVAKGGLMYEASIGGQRFRFFPRR